MRCFVLLAGLLGTSACITPERLPGPKATMWDMEQGLDPLRNAFNVHRNSPRLVALVPPSCAQSIAALQQAKSELEALGQGQSVVWLVVWQDEVLEDTCQSARLACEELDRETCEFFHDCEHFAGRAFADGTVLTGELRRAFLFYPPGAEWGETIPEPSAWVHRTGRIGADHAGGALDLARELRSRWVVLSTPR